jgi:hypothetical protein
MNLVEQLIEEKKFLLKRLEAIDAVLISYGYTEAKERELNPDVPFDAAIIKMKEIGKRISYTVNFPRLARNDKKVLWIFENCFKKGVKINDVQDKFNDLNGFDSLGNEIRIDNVARTLKKNGKLIVVKYNKSNKLSFWGLSSWVDKKGFKDEFKPSDEVLPVNINTIEVVR